MRTGREKSHCTTSVEKQCNNCREIEPKFGSLSYVFWKLGKKCNVKRWNNKDNEESDKNLSKMKHNNYT